MKIQRIEGKEKLSESFGISDERLKVLEQGTVELTKKIILEGGLNPSSAILELVEISENIQEVAVVCFIFGRMVESLGGNMGDLIKNLTKNL